MRPENARTCPSPSALLAGICAAALAIWALAGCTPSTIPANQTNENISSGNGSSFSVATENETTADDQPDSPDMAEHMSGNEAVNYADRALCVGDEDFDYFYSSTMGGICRARTDGSATNVIVPTGDGFHCYISWFSLDGDQLFYLGQSYGDDDDVFGVHTVNTDGSDRKVIYTPDDNSDIEGVYVYDHTVYVLTMANDSYDVWTMGEDGSNQKRIVQGLAAGGKNPFLTSDAIYYVISHSSRNGGDDTPDELYVQDLDGTDARRIYTSGLMSLGYPVPHDGELFITEHGREGTDITGSRLTSMQTDGSDVRTVYSSSDNREFKLVNLTAKNAYLLQDIDAYDCYFGRLLIATYESSPDSAHAIDLPTSYASHNLERGGKHVLDFCNGVPDIGMAVYALDFDAGYIYKVCDYVTDDLTGTDSEDVPQNVMTYDLTDNSGATVTELTGTLRSYYLDTDETGMGWGATEYVLELPSPIAVTYESYGNTRIGNDIVDVVQVSSAENSPALGETEPETDPAWERYVGKVVTLSCTGAFDSGTRHIIFSPALHKPTVVRVF